MKGEGGGAATPQGLNTIDMSNKTVNGPQTPEEFQRQSRSSCGSIFPAPARTTAKTDFDSSAESPESDADEAKFNFDYKPRDVKAYLDRLSSSRRRRKKS